MLDVNELRMRVARIVKAADLAYRFDAGSYTYDALNEALSLQKFVDEMRLTDSTGEAVVVKRRRKASKAAPRMHDDERHDWNRPPLTRSNVYG
jgi:hypothetical protein